MRRVGLVVNPTAGGGRALRAGAVAKERLAAAGCEVVDLSGSDARQAVERARAALEGPAGPSVDVLAVVGGDGMVHLGANLVGGTDLPLGIIAAGTGNDVARGLGLPVGDPAAAAEIVATGEASPIDGVQVTGDGHSGWFAGVLGAGFDALVNERANAMRWPRGRRRYDVAILAELRTLSPMPYRLVLDGQPWSTRALLVAVANSPSYGGGMRISPKASMTDGRLDVVVVGPLSRLEFLRLYPSVYRGEHVHHPAVQIRQAAQVSIESADPTRPVVAYGDGERLAPLPLTARAVPAGIQVLLPSTL